MSLKTLGIFIRQRREQLGYSSRTDFENYYHFGNGTLANFETGHRRPSADMIKRLADIFGMRPGLLVDLMFDVTNLEEAERIAATDSYAQNQTGEPEQWIKLPPGLDDTQITEIKEFAEFKVTRHRQQ